MRNKFFYICLLVLFLSTFSVGGILLAYFRTERLMFLDEQIRQSATSIVESKLSELKTYDDEEAEEIISEELGPQRLGKFFVVRNAEGETLFETQNAALLDVEIPRDAKWVTINTPKHFIRVLNLKLPRFPSRILQVGVIVDSNFISLAYLSNRTYVAILGILITILSLTWALSAYLFSPIGTLAQYLDQVTTKLETQSEVDSVPKSLRRFERNSSIYGQDEFGQLIHAINDMAGKLNVGRKFMKSWTFQMAHELKTPLTILNRDFEIISETYKLKPHDVAEVQRNIDKISQTVSSFLDWAELTSRQTPGDLFVINVGDAILPTFTNLNKIFKNRVVITEQSNFQVLCNPLHLEQLITNILSNSLKYSSGAVELSFGDNSISIKDSGPGIPDDVLARIGSPFNKGGTIQSTKKGVGLGLAWVKTICDLYRWEYHFDSTNGTRFTVRFPVIDTST